MKGFLGKPLARRTAWLVQAALIAAVAAPCATRPARAAEVMQEGRAAYMLDFTAAEGKTVDAALLSGLTHQVRRLLVDWRNDKAVKHPLDLLPVVIDEATLQPKLFARNKIIQRALDEKTIDQAAIDTPPTTKEAALDLAQKLGLQTVIVGKIDAFDLKTDTKPYTASLSFIVEEFPVPAKGVTRQPTAIGSWSKAVTVNATDEKEKLGLPSHLAEHAAKVVSALLLDAPSLQPPLVPPVIVPPKIQKTTNWLIWVAVSIPLVLGVFYLASQSKTSSGARLDNTLAVSGVRTQSTATGVTVTWNQVAAATGYQVYRRVYQDGFIRNRGVSRATSWTALPNKDTGDFPTVRGNQNVVFPDSTAVPGVVYDYSVAGVSSSGTIGPLSAVTSDTRAGAEMALAPTVTASAGNGFVRLTWTADANSAFTSGYLIYRHQGGVPYTGVNSVDQIADVLGATNYDDRDASLINNVSYTYVVQPYTLVNTTGKLIGANSNPVTIAPNSTALPQQTRNVAAVADSSGNVTITWLANGEPNIQSYEILRRQDASGRSVGSPLSRAMWLRSVSPEVAVRMAQGNSRGSARSARQTNLTGFTVIKVVPAAQQTYVDPSLTSGTYTYAVRAVNTSGLRGTEGLSSQVIVQAPPAAPAGLVAQGLNGGVKLTWQGVAGNLRGYRLYRSTTAIDATMVGPASAPGITLVTEVPPTTSPLAYTDTGVFNNTPYYYAVTAMSAASQESLFGKGSTPDLGAVAIPHAAATVMTVGVDRSLISANGKDVAAATVKVTDSTNTPVPGVDVTITTDRGSLTTLPANAVYLDAATHRQVRGLTDSTGQLRLQLQSEVIAVAQSEQTASLQVRAGELPVGQQIQSASVTMKPSLPATLLMSPPSQTLPADLASTCTVVAKVTDSLQQPVPDNAFSVTFNLSSDDGEIRRSGDVQQYPFQRYPTPVTVPVVGGQATLIYRAGAQAGTEVITAAVSGMPAISSQTNVRLVAGTATQMQFSVLGQAITSALVPISGQTIVTVTVLDAQSNPVGAGVAVTFAADTPGLVTVPAGGTTDANGQVQLTIQGGAATADVTISVTAGSATIQLPVQVR